VKLNLIEKRLNEKEAETKQIHDQQKSRYKRNIGMSNINSKEQKEAALQLIQ